VTRNKGAKDTERIETGLKEGRGDLKNNTILVGVRMSRNGGYEPRKKQRIANKTRSKTVKKKRESQRGYQLRELQSRKGRTKIERKPCENSNQEENFSEKGKRNRGKRHAAKKNDASKGRWCPKTHTPHS